MLLLTASLPQRYARASTQHEVFSSVDRAAQLKDLREVPALLHLFPNLAKTDFDSGRTGFVVFKTLSYSTRKSKYFDNVRYSTTLFSDGPSLRGLPFAATLDVEWNSAEPCIDPEALIGRFSGKAYRLPGEAGGETIYWMYYHQGNAVRLTYSGLRAVEQSPGAKKTQCQVRIRLQEELL